MTRYGRTSTAGSAQWVASNPAPVQGLSAPVSLVCGTAFAYAIPGSSPLLCQLNILVITEQPGVFQLTVTGAQSAVPLTPGQLMDGAAYAVQSASYSFTVPDNLSNVTVVVFVTNQATDVTLTVGPGIGEGGSRIGGSIWTVTQQPGNPLVVFQLDWTNSLLPTANRPQGGYVMVVSTQQNATFTVQYTLVNATGYSGTISPLIDGVPELGQLQPSQYAFYFFSNLPQQGWPYAMAFSVTWMSGFGTMIVAAGDGTQPGPLPGQSSIGSGPFVSVNPTNYQACTPNSTIAASGLPCGYAVSLLANAATVGPAQFSLTATTGKWVRTIYPAGPAQSQTSQINPSDVDSWAVRNLDTGSHSATLMVILTLSAGTATLYASNVTVTPNASSSQYSLLVESMNALSIALAPGLSNAVYYVSVACTSSVVCEYALSVAEFQAGAGATRLANGVAVTAALPPGQIGWWYLDVSTFTAVGYVTMQVDPALGSLSVYATCSSGNGPSAQPNETLYTWSAGGPGLVLLEVTNLPANLTAAGCRQVVVGVRATTASSAVFVMSMVTAGTQQDITTLWAGGVGLLTPAYPVSYFLFNMRDDDPTVVLAFTLAATPASCLADLQLLVSPTVVFPNASTPGVTYTWRGAVVLLDSGVTDLSVAITNYTLPLGSLRAGYYFLAVVSQSPNACQYQVQGSNNRQRQLVLGSTVYETASSSAIAYFSYNLPSNQAASFGLSLQLVPATLLLYVGFNSSPRPDDSASYAAVRSFDTSQPGRPAPVYVPPNTCPTSLCAVVFMATSNVSGQYVAVTTATSELSTPLTASQPYVALNSSQAYVGYQFSLPSSSQAVTVTVSSASQVDVACSYQYVQPDGASYDWITNSSAAAYALTNQTTLAFDWTSAFQVNPGSALAAPASACYCTVLPSNASAGFSIWFSSVAVAGPSSSSGLSGGALAAAIVVPTLVALTTLLLLLWLYRRGCRLWAEGISARAMKGEPAQPSSRGDDGVNEADGVAMSDLHAKNGGGRALIHNQQWRSDSS